MICRVLIVGLGSIGKRHLRLARELLPNADIRVLRHQACVAVPEFADGCFSSLGESIKFLPQIAVIANPATLHVGVAQPLTEAGVHLLVEKPLSASLDGVQRLLESCREQKTIMLAGYNLRFLPSLQRFRSLLNDGIVGRVLSVRCEIGQYLPAWRPDTDYLQSVSAQRKLGGGALLELSHEIDYLRWIFGEVDWVKATLCQQGDLKIDVEDTAHLILGFAAVGGHQLIGSVNLDFLRHDTTRLCTAIGEKGSLRWNGLTGAVEYFEFGAKEWHELFRYQHQRDDSYLTEWKHFLHCVHAKETPMISGQDGLRVLQIIEAARHSSDAGGKVKNTKTRTTRINA
ncbi:MAG: Gfo/Idh/MocA family oxidoreductase [Rhodoferax sp.]|nr:Gfo/Idh/MocA family oxidoreductase [Rhodoferax sp.]MDP3651339.1 Gfo/Idh/MocA family oxidoreductase [Rhodoferax sp.]